MLVTGLGGRVEDSESVKGQGLGCEPHYHGKETVQEVQGFGPDKLVTFARRQSMEKVMTGMGRVSDERSCSLSGPGVVQVQERWEVAVNNILG